jgi:hypothetical protein
MQLNQQLTPKLRQLRPSVVLATLNARHRQAIDGQWAYVEFLDACSKTRSSGGRRNNWLCACGARP